MSRVQNVARLRTLFLFIALAIAPALQAACPRLLMFDGVNILKDINPERAAYWGRSVGVDGFFLNNVMATWQQDVGGNVDGPAWETARRFQTLYAAHGVKHNFIKIAIWTAHDWRNAKQNAAIVRNFGHAAALAKHAGFEGVALDLEPYVDIWGGKAGGIELSSSAQSLGRAIAQEMYKQHPGMTLIVIQDALHWARKKQGYHGGYLLSVPFLRGLLSVPWTQVVAATELTYGADVNIPETINSVSVGWEDFIREHDLPVRSIDVAPGLWPLGKSYTDKSARIGAADFEDRLRTAFRSAHGYVWIYGFGSAWQTEGTYGSGPVTKSFPEYLDALHKVRSECKTAQ